MLSASALLAGTLLSSDTVIVQIEESSEDGVGFDVISPGLHDFTVTLQASGMGNEIVWSNGYDANGWIIWDPGYNSTQGFEHSYTAYGLTAEDAHSGSFYCETLQGGMGGMAGVTTTHLDLDASMNDPGMCGMGGETCVPDDEEATTGVGVPITLPGETTLPATLPSGNPGYALWLVLSNQYRSGTLEVTVTGSGAAVYVYDYMLEEYNKVTGPIAVGGYGFYDTLELHTNDNFTGDVTIEVRFDHDDGDTDAADEVKVFPEGAQGPPPQLFADLDVDTNEDGVIDAADDPDEDNPGVFIMLDDLEEAKLEVIAEPSFDLTGYQVLIDITEGAGNISLWNDAQRMEPTSLAPIGYDASPTGSVPFPQQIYIEGISEGEAKVRMRLLDPMGMEADSDVVAIKVEAVDLDIHNGQGASSGVQEKYEDNFQANPIGAFTVANLNDTDGDGDVDKDDDDGVAGEVDLMKLVVWKPKRDTGGSVTLKVVSGSVKLWNNSQKQGMEVELTNGEVQIPVIDINTPAGNWFRKIYWVELTAASTTLRDVKLSLTYNGTSDTVNATGIWATKTGFRNKNSETLWGDVSAAITPGFTVTYGGIFGIKYAPDPIDVQYSMGLEFTIQPSATATQWDNWGVKFDVTRQAENRTWSVTGTTLSVVESTYWEGQTTFTQDGPIGTNVDKANDDTTAGDEDNTPENDHIYSVDGPGMTNNGRVEQVIRRLNFLEFVRVNFNDVNPSGNTTDGSRCSPKISWYADIWAERDPSAPTTYRQRAGKPNAVALGYTTILPAPTP